jgi:hypothetical protein
MVDEETQAKNSRSQITLQICDVDTLKTYETFNNQKVSQRV